MAIRGTRPWRYDVYEYEHEGYDPPDGFCESCGMDLDEDPLGDHDEHHRWCWRCWRAEDNESQERSS